MIKALEVLEKLEEEAMIRSYDEAWSLTDEEQRRIIRIAYYEGMYAGAIGDMDKLVILELLNRAINEN